MPTKDEIHPFQSAAPAAVHAPRRLAASITERGDGSCALQRCGGDLGAAVGGVGEGDLLLG